MKENIIGEWQVPSWTSNAIYTVKRDGSKWSCSCFYWLQNKKQCKHITQKKQELGLVKPDYSHYRSGVQKAIRRGSLPLLKRCFSKLWGEDKSWLMWRLPVLACEETWPFTEIAVEMALDKELEREQVWKLLANITLKPKNKEVEGIAELLYLYKTRGFDAEKFIEDEGKLRMFKEILKIKDSEALWKENKNEYWMLYSEPLNEVSKKFFSQMKRRINYAGPSDMFVVAAYFSTIFELEPVELDDVPKEEEVETAERIPWYAYDVHTSLGKVVYYQLKKVYGEEMGEYLGNELWWFEESAVCDKLVEDSYWWSKNREIWYRARGKTIKQAERDWQGWGPEIKKRVVEKIMARERAFGQKQS
jgi:hypothetical protein